MKKIHCEIHDNGGCFNENFKWCGNWQEEIRSWVKHIRNRFGLTDDAKMSIYSSKDGCTFNFVKEMSV